jgi:hypothetical protein
MEQQALPRWAAITDAVAGAAIALGITIQLSGGFREATPIGQLSMTSGVRPLLLGLLLLAVRHWRAPRPHVVSRARRGLAQWWRSPEGQSVAPIFLSTRIGVLVIGFVGIALLGYAPDTPPYRVYENDLLNMPARWDTGWYMGIAERGYDWQPANQASMQNIAFFPAFPFVMRYVSLPLGRHTIWAGVLVSLVSFFFALRYLFALARDRLGDEVATQAVVFIAAYPFALFFSAAYSESLFLLAALAACYHFQRDQLGRAAAWGLLAGLTRPNGCFLSIALALLAIRDGLTIDGRLLRRMLAASAPGLGLIAFSAYIWSLTGDPFEWAQNHAAYGRVYRGAGDLILDRLRYVQANGLYHYISTLALDWINGLPVLLAVAAIWPVYRLMGVAYAALVAVNVAVPVLIGGVLSMGRVTSTLFPVFIWLAVSVPPPLRTSFLIAFAMAQAVLAIAFFTWRPLY